MNATAFNIVGLAKIIRVYASSAVSFGKIYEKTQYMLSLYPVKYLKNIGIRTIDKTYPNIGTIGKAKRYSQKSAAEYAATDAIQFKEIFRIK